MQKRALIVGLGIAGMSAAIGLRRAGWTPVIVERAPGRRTGGYFINLMPDGMEAAAGLGLDHLHTRSPEAGSTWSLNRRGHRRPAPGWLDLPGHPTAMVRGDVEAALWHRIRPGGDDGIEVRFGTSPLEITERDSAVEVLLNDASTGRRSRETFDLVIGADGLRSTVRRLVFGPHERFMTTWNAMICAFPLPGQAPSFGAQDSLISARAGRAVWVFGLADRPPTALLTYCTKDIDAQFTGDRTERLRTVFGDMDHPAVRHVLDALPTTPDYLFDSVHQVKMERWSSGRVMLAGDAAWCLNLFSGMGTTAALRGGAELGRALEEHPDSLGAALATWEARLRPFITTHQRMARLKHQWFVPTNRFLGGVRTLAMHLAVNARRAATEERLLQAAAPVRGPADRAVAE
ncbi:oxidoreductase [Streptomyces sp. A0958]|uniref:FAD-dependent monooxygenase n=1 Tax=Streptomyces sp. A0958 TaxID=2563101 RepID=UPI00109E43D8|nr:FAD-dependent monooxygenase [Streptomyces sp. A0958]THA70008.1 oxidoreductase [Streptomyces sp. A0958]